MKNLKLYEQFVEQNTVVEKLNALMKGFMKTIKGWFTNGSLSKHSLTLYDLELSSITDHLEKSIIFSFSDDSFFYQIEFVVRLADYDQGIFKKAFLKIKKYSLHEQPLDSLSGMLIDVWDSNDQNLNPKGNGQINISEFTEDKILEIISELDNEPQAPGTNAEGLKKMGGEVQSQPVQGSEAQGGEAQGGFEF
jgi:hypothetical protein